MSFTNQKQRIATEEECCARWGGDDPGKRFRCYICGHKFIPGDKWRFVGAGVDGNFMVCEKCDGEDVLERWKRHYAEAEKRLMNWISIKDKLPVLRKKKDGSVNAVIVYYKIAPECSGHEQVSNVEYFLKHIKQFSHWCYFPPKPKGEDGKSKLKLCPFCGSKPEEFSTYDGHWIRCSNPKCFAAMCWTTKELAMIKAWNRRAKLSDESKRK